MSAPVWFITAASSGFGKGIALEALKRGHRVIATSRQSSKLTDLKTKGAVTMDLDVTQDEGELKQIVAEAHKVYGRIDYLINAAGYLLEGALEEASPKEVYDSFNTNVFGIINVTRAVLPYMREQKSGVIALFGSIASWMGIAAISVYCSCKWAISGLAESLRLEVQPFGIEVCCVEPGYFRSGFLNPGARQFTETRIKAYDESVVGQVREFLNSRDNKQPGDILRGCAVIVDVLSKKTVKEVPVRLVLGSDAYGGIVGKCDDTKKLMEEMKDQILSTDYPEGQ